jgi:hypothetical protein
LSWDGGQTGAPADGEDRSAEAHKPMPPPKVDAAVEPILQEATLVEGIVGVLDQQPSKGSNRGR